MGAETHAKCIELFRDMLPLRGRSPYLSMTPIQYLPSPFYNKLISLSRVPAVKSGPS